MSIYAYVWSYSQNVQDIFIDIKSDYKYLNELQSLYDKWVMLPDENGKFNPTKLLTRDEFVWVVMEVSCKDCMKPNTALEYIAKYTWEKIFYDVKETNTFFYCIADGKQTDVVKWYGNDYTCDDKTYKAWENPFCTNNNITLEEALAVLLRNSSVFTIQDNNDVIAQIQAGSIKDNLAKDVSVKNIDGSVYTFYGYFKKALELSYEEYDIYGNKKTYDLVKVDANGNLNPKKYISKEEFLNMSYIISKMNACGNTLYQQDNSRIAAKIDIFDASCVAGEKNCKKSTLDTKNTTYDFWADVNTTCQAGIKKYTWVFYNRNDGTFLIETGKYLDNYILKTKGIWYIRLIIEDNCWNTVESKSVVSYFWDEISKKDNNISLVIEAKPIAWYGPLWVDFESIVHGCDNCSFYWNFWDGATSNLKNPNNHTFVKNGAYQVELVVTDGDGNTARSLIVVVVRKNYDEILWEIDTISKKYDIDMNELKQLVWSWSLQDMNNKIDEIKSENKNNSDLWDDLERLKWLIGSDVGTGKIDSDMDGVYDNDDKCVNLKGPQNNQGCPILEIACEKNEKSDSCKSGYVCNSSGYCEVDKTVNNDLVGSCIYPSNGSSVFGNRVCDTCPCEYEIDFIASVRKCDIIIPTITSIDKKEIYGRGEPYQLPYEYK